MKKIKYVFECNKRQYGFYSEQTDMKYGSDLYHKIGGGTVAVSLVATSKHWSCSWPDTIMVGEIGDFIERLGRLSHDKTRT